MLPRWLKSPSRRADPPTPKKPSSPSRFYFSSFKDIQTVLNEGSDPEPGSPKRISIFNRVRISRSFFRAFTRRSSNAVSPSPSLPSITLPNLDPRRIIVYFTSLRIVRRTFEDCKTVRSILRGFCVPIDERDLSMDANFLEELQEITGSHNLTLPCVFVAGRYIGGAEEVKQLNESGELSKLIGRLTFVDPTTVCDVCGGLRFVVCVECGGSHKIYCRKSGFICCKACNINGLIRCSSCCPVSQRFI